MVASLLSLPDEVLGTIVYYWVVSYRARIWAMEDVNYGWVKLALINRRFRRLIRRSGSFYSHLSILDLNRNMRAMYQAFDTKWTQRPLHLNINVGTGDRSIATREFMEDVAGRLVEVNLMNGEGLGDVALPEVKVFVGRRVSIPFGLSANMCVLRLDGCNANMDGPAMLEYLNTMPCLHILALENITYTGRKSTIESVDKITALFLPRLTQLMLDLMSIEHQELMLAIENSEAHPELKHTWFTRLPDQDILMREAIRTACRLIHWDYQSPVVVMADESFNAALQGSNYLKGEIKCSVRVLEPEEITWLLVFQDHINHVDFGCAEAVERFCCQGYKLDTVAFLYPGIDGILSLCTTHYPRTKRLILRWVPGSDGDEDDAELFWADHIKEAICDVALRTIAVQGPVTRRDTIRRAQPSHAWMHPVVQYCADEVSKVVGEIPPQAEILKRRTNYSTL
jgi:hypothetical protein